jgi:hypothetical protein
VRKSDKLTAICEPIVERNCGSLDVSQPYGLSRPVIGIIFLQAYHFNGFIVEVLQQCQFGKNFRIVMTLFLYLVGLRICRCGSNFVSCFYVMCGGEIKLSHSGTL